MPRSQAVSAPASAAPSTPPHRPDQVLLGLIRRREPRPAQTAARDIGRGIGRPDHDQQGQQQAEAQIRHRAQPDQSQRRQAQIGDPEAGPGRRTARRPGDHAGEQRAAQQAGQGRLGPARGEQQHRADADHEHRTARDPTAPVGRTGGCTGRPIPAPSGRPSARRRRQSSSRPATTTASATGSSASAERMRSRSAGSRLSHPRPRSGARDAGTPRSPRPDDADRTRASGPAGTPARCRPSARA